MISDSNYKWTNAKQNKLTKWIVSQIFTTFYVSYCLNLCLDELVTLIKKNKQTENFLKVLFVFQINKVVYISIWQQLDMSDLIRWEGCR